MLTVTGIWPEGADGTDVNACSRSHNHELVASADDFGKVNLYKYPACQPKVSATFKYFNSLWNLCRVMFSEPLLLVWTDIFISKE